MDWPWSEQRNPWQQRPHAALAASRAGFPVEATCMGLWLGLGAALVWGFSDECFPVVHLREPPQIQIWLVFSQHKMHSKASLHFPIDASVVRMSNTVQRWERSSYSLRRCERFKYPYTVMKPFPTSPKVLSLNHWHINSMPAAGLGTPNYSSRHHQSSKSCLEYRYSAYPGRLKKRPKSWLRCLQQLHSFPPSWNKGCTNESLWASSQCS